MASEKYAVGEFERRFLLSDIPPGVTNPRNIVDLYIDKTRLRLRAVEQADTATRLKLGHKRRLVATDPTAIMHTSMYLDSTEFDVLASLPSTRLAKTRWAIDIDGQPGSVDVFQEALTGLVIVEVDCEDRSRLDDFVPPAWAGPEVTGDEAFTGGALAGKSLGDLADAVALAYAET